MSDKIDELLDKAKRIVIVQADNPDADSLGSALALEQILGDMGKEPLLYCAVDIPSYLKYLAGWDRVQNDLPQQFEASIIVDASTLTLLEKLNQSSQQSWLANKPCLVLDHHESASNLIPFATQTINDPGVSSTGELIYSLASKHHWPLSLATQEFLMTAILGDTQGLTNGQTKVTTYRVIANMVEAGVDRSKLEEKRREFSKMTIDIFKYKARLLERTTFLSEGRLAIVSIPNSEITEFSAQYNPKLLIQYEMLQTVGVQVSIVFKVYDNGRLTGAIRCNPEAPIANKLAERFDGGGHPYAAGFRILETENYNDVQSQVISTATELLNALQAS